MLFKHFDKDKKIDLQRSHRNVSKTDIICIVILFGVATETADIFEKQAL